MAELPRLNGVIGALEKGQHALTTFTPADVESAVALAAAKYDAVVYEMEHNAYDIRAFRDHGARMPPASGETREWLNYRGSTASSARWKRANMHW